MIKLTQKEEEVMKILWKLEKAFVKEIIEKYPDPKPPYNTISSLVRLLQSKGVIGFTRYGNTFQYYPILSKFEYRESTLGGIIGDYFDNSYKNILAFLVKDDNLTDEEAKELIDLIKNKDK